MTIRIDNQSRIVHAETGLVLGIRGAGMDTYFPIILAQSAAPVALTGTTNETALANIVVPGGVIGPNGSLRITFLTSNTNNANNKTFKVKLGATLLMPYTYTAIGEANQILMLRNRGSLATQTEFNTNATAFGTTTAAPGNTNIDTSVDQVLTITGQLAAGADTMTLEGYTIEVLPGA